MSALRTAAVAAVSMAASAAFAQVPDAGILLRQNTPPQQQPQPSPPLDLRAAPPSNGSAPAGGASVQVATVRIEGLSTIDPQAILDELPPTVGRSFDFAGLRGLAVFVEERVRARGLPFARAYLPPQDLSSGQLRIAVVEGRYGQVRAQGDRVAEAQPWLTPLQPGAPIEAAPLERTLMLMNDLPGVTTRSILRPGAQTGTGDLEVQVQAQRSVTGELGADNYGNKYAGRARVRAGIDVESPFLFGDHFVARANYSEEGTWLGGVSYTLPVGVQGWRAQFGLSRTDYQLGKDFASLDAHGTADVLSAGASYPVLRTQTSSLRLAAAWQHKRLHDARDAVQVSEDKRSNLLSLALSGDRSDGGGVTWGAAALSFGRLQIDDALRILDQATARTEGSFEKLNFDISRTQALAAGWSVHGRLSAQWASKNLDSSEKFVLGGPYGVRAWPNGEATGDQGWLTQLELRYRAGPAEPFVFVDAGRVRINREPWTAAPNERGIEGAGLGLRWLQGPWIADVAVGWHSGDEPSTSEAGASRARAWLNLGYRF
jgi:hemolysin activation/secretion protein